MQPGLHVRGSPVVSVTWHDTAWCFSSEGLSACTFSLCAALVSRTTETFQGVKCRTGHQGSSRPHRWDSVHRTCAGPHWSWESRGCEGCRRLAAEPGTACLASVCTLFVLHEPWRLPGPHHQGHFSWCWDCKPGLCACPAGLRVVPQPSSSRLFQKSVQTDTVDGALPISFSPSPFG